MKITKKKINNYNDLLYLKQIFSIIFKYHKKRKTIIFLGVPSEIMNKYKEKIIRTKHIFISDDYWTKGLLTNKSAFVKGLRKKNSVGFKKLHIQKYLTKKKKPNLLVVFNHKNKLEILKETAKLKIPVISFFESGLGNFILYPIILSKTKMGIKYNNLIFYLLNTLFRKN